MAAPEHATWYDDVSMTSPGGSALLTSAVGPADVSVDQVNIDWSIGSVGSVSQWVPKVSLILETYNWGPRVRVYQKKKKGKRV